tara:strand:- start:11004 stop:11570 length:567 start_codon:yes stop_codon:yes gene_type:complete
MINTKKTITSRERGDLISELRSEHQPYFDRIGKSNAIFIPKMAYIPSGKDELHISFFESELKKECDIYTEFVNIQYISEDPKRTLYLVRYNPFWKEEYEVITSKSGYERHFIPVNEIVPLNNMSDRFKIESKSYINPDEVTPIVTAIDTEPIADINKEKEDTDLTKVIRALEDINYTLQKLTHIIRNK